MKQLSSLLRGFTPGSDRKANPEVRAYFAQRFPQTPYSAQRRGIWAWSILPDPHAPICAPSRLDVSAWPETHLEFNGRRLSSLSLCLPIEYRIEYSERDVPDGWGFFWGQMLATWATPWESSAQPSRLVLWICSRRGYPDYGADSKTTQSAVHECRITTTDHPLHWCGSY